MSQLIKPTSDWFLMKAYWTKYKIAKSENNLGESYYFAIKIASLSHKFKKRIPIFMELMGNV